MTKTLLGMVTFGNTMFTKQALESCRNTSDKLDYFVIVGKPEDGNTRILLHDMNIPFKVHTENRGFPASVNDIYDYGFKEHDYDNIIFMGNDVVVYPYTIDSLIEFADTNDYSAVSTQEINVKDIVNMYPETKQFFSGDSYITNNLDHRAWEKFTNYTKEIKLSDPNGIVDIHNLCLYKREVFNTIGYIDVNFYPAYFEDNDYVQRMKLTGLKSCTIDSKYFHFWSRTIKQETGGSSNKFFELNREYYMNKWGGMPKNEKYDVPFNGTPYKLLSELDIPCDINIQRRDLESYFINYWKNK